MKNQLDRRKATFCELFKHDLWRLMHATDILLCGIGIGWLCRLTPGQFETLCTIGEQVANVGLISLVVVMMGLLVVVGAITPILLLLIWHYKKMEAEDREGINNTLKGAIDFLPLLVRAFFWPVGLAKEIAEEEF